MDNDILLKKKIVQLIKKIKFKIDYYNKKILSENEGNNEIAKYICSNEPFLCTRLGAVESRCIDKWINNKKFSKENIEQVYYAAGVFPQTEEAINNFCNVYTESLKNVDLLGIWNVVGEKKIIKKYCNKAKLIPLRSIEPYYYINPWSKYLRDKNILIIHPFVESIKNQYEIREKLFCNKEVLPSFKNLILIKAIQSNAGAVPNFKSWLEALEYMKGEIDKVDFDIAIIGAGAYGLPLAAYVKSKNKQAIHMAGATQILFGIKGKRWDNHKEISKLYNENWIRPSKNEIPPNPEKVEGGSYW